MAEPTIADRVAAGMAWLDQHDPGWWRADATPVSSMHDSQPIDLDRLDLASPCGCILGHRWGHIGHALLDAPDDISLVAMGFDANPGATDLGDAEYRHLTAEWRRVIAARRAEAVTVDA